MAIGLKKNRRKLYRTSMAPRKKVVQTPVVAPPVADPTPVVVVAPEQVPEPVIEVKQKAKREKKATKHKVVAIITPNGIEGTFQNESRRPLIAHLPIHSSDIQFHDQPITYDPNPPCQPEAFNAEWIDPFASEAMFDNAPEQAGAGKDMTTVTQQEQHNELHTCSSSSKELQHTTSHSVLQPSSRKEYGPTTLLVQYKDTHTTKELPSQTELACFWCCEQFTGRPCVIPNSIVQDIWNVYGNYCTPQCAMAYLLSEILDTHTRWERISLLNRLYAKQINGRIYPAPNRESLQRFGGPIKPEEFRSICESQNIRVDIHMPPMVSILASMDTKPIDFYETPLRNTFTSPHQVSIQRQQEEPVGLKLKRTKPLKDKESTLDVCLQITTR
jgi:hypothetical protein